MPLGQERVPTCAREPSFEEGENPMGFVESNLLPNETIVYETRLHPVIYTPAVVALLLGLGTLGVCAATAGGDSGFLVLLALMIVVVAAGLALSAWINTKASEFAVTNRRVLVKVGWLRRDSFEIVLPKVEGIGVDQGLLGRLFNFGTIDVRGTGGSRERFANIAAPLEFRKQVQLLLPEQ